MSLDSNEVTAEVPVTETKEEKTLTGPELMVRDFQKLLSLSEFLSKDMSSRQLGRVMRSLLRAPFAEHDKFVDIKEKQLFDIGIRIMDIKMLVVAEQIKEAEKPINEVKKEAARLEQEEGNKENG